MDISFYRMREEQERALAARARDAKTRKAHVSLADRYRSVVEAYEELERVAPHSRGSGPLGELNGTC